jgi:hypothetical protein
MEPQRHREVHEVISDYILSNFSHMTLANASVIVTSHMHAYGQYKLKSLIESRINLLCVSVVPFRSTLLESKDCAITVLWAILKHKAGRCRFKVVKEAP